MPIWLRKFTFNAIKEFYDTEKEEYEKASGNGQIMKSADQLAKMAKNEKALQKPTYVSKVSKK
jgi:hypothetical protein